MCGVFVAAGFSVAVESGDYSRVVMWASNRGGFSVVELGLWRMWAQQLPAVEAHGLSHGSSWALEHGLSSCGSGAWWPHTCARPRSEIKPASPTLAGGFFTTEPPWKLSLFFKLNVLLWNDCRLMCSYKSKTKRPCENFIQFPPKALFITMVRHHYWTVDIDTVKTEVWQESQTFLSQPHPLPPLSFISQSDQFSRSVMFNSLRPHELQHARPPCPSPTSGVYPNSCPSSQWCRPAISSSVVPFSSCP